MSNRRRAKRKPPAAVKAVAAASSCECGAKATARFDRGRGEWLTTLHHAADCSAYLDYRGLHDSVRAAVAKVNARSGTRLGYEPDGPAEGIVTSGVVTTG